MAAPKIPVTNAIRVLREHGVVFVPYAYPYVEKGGTAASALALGIAEHAVIKTLIMETDTHEPLVVLMHGDKQVSTKQLARCLEVKSVQSCKEDVADRHSGYQVGGTSPFGTRRAMRVCMERTILALPRIWINGGRRGLLVALAPSDVVRVLRPVLVDVAIDG